MNQWDLTTIYPSFESKAFQEDLAAVQEDITSLNELKLTDDFESSASEFINRTNSLIAKLYPLGAFTRLTYSVDSGNVEALKYSDKIQMIAAELTAPQVKFNKWLAQFDVDKIKNSTNPVISKHKFILQEFHEQAQHLLSDDEEILLSKLQNVGSSAWSDLMGKLTGELQAEFEIAGETKEYTLSMLRNFAYHDDQNVRKRAYETELAAYEKVDVSVASSLSAIKGEVNLISKLRGYESPLDQAVKNSRLDMATLDAMIEAMKEKLPAFRRYLKQKAKILGHQNGLPFYDLFAPVNDSNLTYTYEEAQAFVLKNFGDFSDELKASAKRAFDNNWVDVEPRKGKRGGAFCSHIVTREQSRIMLNFDGSFSDVSTLAHELGHGYHNYILFKETPLNCDYPMPLAETASIFCETIVTNAATKTATPEEAVYILEKSIEGSNQVIVDILSRFIFEKSVFEARNDGPLTVDQLKELMITAQKEAYGDGLDENYLHPYMWACKPHYYSAGLSYYNFPYAFGLLFGLGLYAEYQSGRENFVEDYNKLLANTTKMNAKDVAATMGIDITKKDFWLASLQIVEDQIDEFIRLTDK